MDRLRATQTTLVGFIITLVIACLSLTADAQIPNIPQNVRKAIELTLGAKGIYIPSEGAFKVRMVRKDIQQTAVEDGFPGILPESWAAFGPAFHQQEGEFAATESELQSVLKALRSKRLHSFQFELIPWVSTHSLYLYGFRVKAQP
jgi:hypothetical protein